MSTLSQFALACNSIVLKEVLVMMFENDNEHDFNLVIDMHTKFNDLGMRIRQRADLILDVEKKGYSAEVFESMKLLKDLQETDNAKARTPPTTYTDLFDDYIKKLSASLKRGKIDTRDLPVIRRCDTTSVEEIRLKDDVIAKLNSRVFKLEAIIKVHGRERKGVSLGPAMIDLDSDDDLVKEVQMRDEKEKMLKYEEDKKKRRYKLMNSDHWKLYVSKISNRKRTQRSSAFSAYYWGNTFAMAEKDRPLNSLNDQDMNLFLKDVTPWVEDLSRYNRATDRVHLTDTFDIFLGWQGPLRCRFPWCKDHVELWVNYMWHVRPHDADWAMVGGYFVQLFLQDSIPSWYADDTFYKVSWCDVEEVYMPINETDQHWCLAHLHIRIGLVTFYDSGVTYDPEWCECVPTPFSARLLGINSDEQPIIEVDDIGYQMDITLHVYHQTHEEFQNLGVEANSGSFFVGAFRESLILSNETDPSILALQFCLGTCLDHLGRRHELGELWDCQLGNFTAGKDSGGGGNGLFMGELGLQGTEDRGCGYFMWMDDFRTRISSSSGPSTPPSLYTRPSTRPSYSAGSYESALNLRKAECSNCKFLAEKIKTLEAKIKILEGTLEMERHPENHTLETAAILHELYNDMGKLCLE
ncbi:phospholipase-like protein [Tanacetum coccineum]